jgi:hypothetical protein
MATHILASTHLKNYPAPEASRKTQDEAYDKAYKNSLL